MKRHQAFSFAVALALWAGAATQVRPSGNAGLPSLAADRARWIPVEARNHVTGARGPAAVLFGGAHERGRDRPASLRVECFDGATAVHIDADGLTLGPWAVAVRLQPRRRSLRRGLLAAQRRRVRPRVVGRARRRVRERAVRQGRAAPCRRAAAVGAVPVHVHRDRRRTGPAPAGRPVPLVGRTGDQRRRPARRIVLSLHSMRSCRGEARRLTASEGS